LNLRQTLDDYNLVVKGPTVDAYCVECLIAKNFSSQEVRGLSFKLGWHCACHWTRRIF